MITSQSQLEHAESLEGIDEFSVQENYSNQMEVEYSSESKINRNFVIFILPLKSTILSNCKTFRISDQ